LPFWETILEPRPADSDDHAVAVTADEFVIF
jgi:hypothetical protein